MSRLKEPLLPLRSTGMERISLDDFVAGSAEFDRLALSADGLDRFCTSSAWVLPAWESFAAGTEPWILHGENGWAAFARMDHPAAGPCLLPPEATWGLASPLVLRNPRAGVYDALVAMLADPGWSTLLLTGIAPDSPLFIAVRSAFGRLFTLRRVSETRRVLASLDGGLDGFLARRSRKFRANLRRAQTTARDCGITFTRLSLRAADDVDAIYPTIMGIESLSWKSRAGEGVDREPMRSFIAGVMRRCAARDDLRLVLAEKDGRLVGYLHGSVAARGFRGLQMSYDEELAHLSLGNLLQAEMIAWLCEDPEVELYDLGSELEYKHAWGESVFTTWSIAAARR
jgi:hypothetical protein